MLGREEVQQWWTLVAWTFDNICDYILGMASRRDNSQTLSRFLQWKLPNENAFALQFPIALYLNCDYKIHHPTERIG